MKRLSMVMLIMMLSSFVITFTSCETDTEDLTGPINTSLPEITAIEVSEGTVLKGGEVDVSVTAKQGDSYEWSADAGTFGNPNSAQTTWTAPNVEALAVFKLYCKVTNSAGSRNASVTVKVATDILPEGAIAYWSFDFDLDEGVNGVTPEGGAGVSITSGAKIGSGAALFEGEDMSDASQLRYDIDAPMGPDDQFTVSMWIKTVDDGLGWLFGRSFDDGYYEGGKGFFMDGASIQFDISWVGGFGADADINDGEWHHIAVVKTDSEILFFIDGDEAGGGEYDDWSDDDGTLVAIGAASEEEGADWPGTFQGSMDEVIFFDQALSADEILNLASQ